MLLKDIVNQANWETVKERLLQLYPKQGKNIIGYEAVFSKLKILSPVDCGMRLMLSEVKAEDTDSEDWKDVYGIEKEQGEDPKCIGYGMEFMEWDKWIGLELTRPLLNNYANEDIITHCLLDMTFWGFDEASIQKEAQTLNGEDTDKQDALEEDEDI